MRSIPLLAAACLLAATLAAVAENPSDGSASTGQSGLVHMPDGRINEDGEWRVGVSRMAPYSAIWSSVTLLPRFEFSGRFTQSDDVVAFGGTTDFGDSKDKAFDAKLLLVREDGWLPAVSVGVQDFHGTRLFGAEYLAASKRVDDFDFTLGYGRKRIDGVFGGARWTLPWGGRRISLLAEYDGIDYENDFHATRTGELVREGGLTGAFEYRGDIFTLQLSRQASSWGANAYVRLPLQQRTFVSKTEVPAPVEIDAAARRDWVALPAALEPLHAALVQEGFSSVRLLVEDGGIRASMSTQRYSTLGRAAGRAARVVALTAPDAYTTLELTFVENNIPVVTYHFGSLELLRGYYARTVAPETLQPTLQVAYADADRYMALRDHGLPLAASLDDPAPRYRFIGSGFTLGARYMLTDHGESPGVLVFSPFNLASSFNDPNGAFRYDLYSRLSYGKWFSDRLYVSASGRISLDETMSEVTGVSNSTLPRVRSEIGEYLRQTGRLGLLGAHIGYIANPRDRIYTWFSAGYLEMMFGGIGGEVLYLPQTGNWAVEASAYAVRQRDFNGGFDFQAYQTVTALAGLHYRIPSQGLTLTARAGRFLAKDLGVRMEVKRRFRSGFEMGAWYSYTDAKDITSPGSPDNPYRDKGVFLRVALAPFLARDSAAGADFSVSPWSRDPGQMVNAPGGLYSMFERRLMLNIDEFNPWSDFGQ